MSEDIPSIGPSSTVDAALRTEARRDREIGSVANAMRLIDALGEQDEAGVSELSRSLGLSKPSVDRLLSTLMSSGYVEQNTESRKYRLTIKFVAIADSIRPRTGIIDIARPYLHELSERFHETVNLGTLSGGSIIYADSIPSRQTFRIVSKPGSILPAYCTAMGKAILAHRPAAELEQYLLDLVPTAYTPQTTASSAQLRERVEQVRRTGWAFDEGEILEEVYCAAAPVIGADGWAVAALSITAPRSNFLRRQRELVDAVIEVAGRMSETVRSASGSIRRPG